jgi:V8-like Glu-specific endopeptidase
MTAGLFADHAKDEPDVPQTDGSSTQETVYYDPGDTRVQVKDTARVPWRAVCHLHVIRESGFEEIGTGWLAGPDLVVTAGHNALRHERAGRASAIRITPGHDGTARPPFSALEPVSMYLPQRWEENGDPAFDYAFLRLASGSIGGQFGYFGFTSGTDAFFEGVLANVPGYPGDKPYGSLWFDAGRLFQVGPTLLAYHIDTEAGCSGAPLFYKHGDQRLVIGMHTQGDPTPSRQRSNRGLRMAESFLEDLLRATSH